jgi:alkylation response protein AidB-like acyl-CoA dehydrogenase
VEEGDNVTLVQDEDHGAMQDAANRLLQQRSGLGRRRARLAGQDGLDRLLWSRFAEMGWLGWTVPEAATGLGQGLAGPMALVETMGRHLVLEPFQEGALAASRLLMRLGDAAQQAALLPGIVDGTALTLPAHEELGARYALSCVQTRARRDPQGWCLDGAKAAVPFGPDADRLLVTARTGGALDAQDGISLFVVERGNAGLSWQPGRGIDGTPTADLQLQGLRLPHTALLGPEGGAFGALASAQAVLLAAACADAVGTMQALLETTRDHAQIRRQFGQPLGSFQVIAHRLVDMFTQIELSRSMAALAAREADGATQGPPQWLRLSASKVQISAACQVVGEHAIQIHGGIGMTDELAASHLYRRLIAIERRLGDRFHHLGQLAAAISAGGGLYA